MKTKYPNASLLTIITQLFNNKESVLFLIKKTLPDYYSLPDIHWYKGYGSNGVPKSVWPKLSIRQWCVCGKDNDIEDLFNSIVENKHLTTGSKPIQLRLPNQYSQIEDTDYYYQRGDEVSLCFSTENNDLIPSEFYQKQNLKILSGYEKGTEIKPLFPLGIFEEDFIHRNVSNGVWAIKETRRSYTTFRGTRESSIKGIGSKEIVGFYQSPYLSTTYSCAIYNEKDNILGESVINKDNGLFEIKLQQPTINGKLKIFREKQEKFTIKYTLLQDIKIETNLTDSAITDAYGRKFIIGSRDKKRPSSIPAKNWQRSIYAEGNVANKELSDNIRAILDYLGPHILIADPYYLGDFKEDPVTGTFELSDSQIAFLNALIHSAVEKEIKSIDVLGHRSRAKTFIENDDSSQATIMESLFVKYEKYLISIVKNNKVEKNIPKGVITFLNSKEDFHNRYWFSLEEQYGQKILKKCVILTNSISKMIEVDIMPVSDEAQLKQIIRKFSELLESADIKLIV